MKTLFSRSRGLQVLFASALIYALAFNLSGCGKDNPVNNNGGNPPAGETLVFSMSEFKLETNTWVSQKDTLINFTLTGTDSLKATFNLSTNCDSSLGDRPRAEFGLNWFPYSWQYTSMNDLNKSHTVYAACNDSFFVALTAKFEHVITLRYLKFTDIKVFKIHN